MIYLAYTADPMPDAISLNSVRSWLRIGEDDDQTIIRLLKSAMLLVEKKARQPLFERTYTVSLDGFISGKLPGVNRKEVAIRYVTANSPAGTLTLSDPVSPLTDPYRILPDGKIVFRAESVASLVNALVTIQYKAGYGTGEVPEDIVDAVLLIAASRYDGRTDSVSERRTAVDDLLQDYTLYD